MNRRAGLIVALAAWLGLAEAAAPQAVELSAAERRAVAGAGLSRGAVVFARGGLVVAIRERGRASAGGGVLDGVVLHGEVVSEEAAQAFGYRSMRSTLNVDCARRRDLVTRMTIYSEPNSKGLAIVRQVPGDWAQPSPGAYLSSVNRALCGPASEAAPKEAPPKPRVTRDARKAIETPPAERPARLARAPANLDDPDAPMITAVEAGYRPLPDNTLGRAPALRAQLEPPPPTPSKPAAGQVVSSRPRAAKPGKVAAQIAASSTERQAREALAKLKGSVAPPQSTQVRKVAVGGKTYYRALVEGFQSRAEAQAFCDRVGVECFLR